MTSATADRPIERRKDTVRVGVPDPGMEIQVPGHLLDVPLHGSVERLTEQLRRRADDPVGRRRLVAEVWSRHIARVRIAVVNKDDSKVLDPDPPEFRPGDEARRSTNRPRPLGTPYDVSRDGSRVYLLRRNDDPPPGEIHVVLGWRALLE
jgi:hypothetical protein